MADTPTGIVTFLFTDIEGSTTLHENHPTRMRDVLKRHDDIFRSNVEAKGGYVFATADDAFSVAFNTPMEALEAVLAIQRALLAEEWPENVEVRVRTSLHSGRAEERDGNFFGTQVDLAARLMSAGHGGQVLLSDATYNLVREELVHLEPEAELRYLGEHRLKDLEHTERIFQLIVPDLPASFPSLNTDGLVAELVNLDRRYRRLGYLGGGGFGDVYLVHDEDLDKDMALKVMKDQYAKDERFVELFRREAQNMANLDHPNIANVKNTGEGIFEGRRVFYIAMEYVSGGTLKDLIRGEGGPLSPLVAVGHAMRVAEALGAAHQSGLIHRDIKPENILITESDVPKVADFGIARAASAASSSGLRLATPRYISPEQAEGEPATFRSDLYSLGVVLYEMLTGEVPYDAESDWGIVSQHIRGQLRPPREVNPNVSKGINQVCVRLLAKDPNQRYPDAATLIEDLKTIKDNPDAFVDHMGLTMPLEEVREDEAPTTTLTLSIPNLLAELYLQARRLHRDREWQAVVDVFAQIHSLDPEYPDAEGLLASAREELAALEPTEQTRSWTNRLSELYAQARGSLTGQTPSKLYAQARRLHRAQEWQAVVDIFDQIHALDPAYSDPERLLVSAREELAAQELEQRVTTIYDQGRQHMEAEEWQQALECFEEVRRLKSSYRETERLLLQVRCELIGGIAPSNVDRIQFLRTLEGHTEPVYCVAFSPDGRMLASNAFGNTVRLWQVEDGALLHTLEGHTNSESSSVAFSPDGRLLASGADDNTVLLWRVEDGTLLRTLKGQGHTDFVVVGVAFSLDGRLLASSSEDNTVRLWRVEDGALLRTLEGQKVWVTSAAFSPDGRLLASGANDKSVWHKMVWLWRVEDGALLRTLEGHTQEVISVAFSPDGRLLAASGADDKMVRLWRVEDGALLHTLESYSYFVCSIAFSPDGRLLALGSEDNTVRLWQVEEGTWLRTLEGHTGWVNSVAFSPDGRMLASGSEDKTVRLWGIA